MIFPPIVAWMNADATVVSLLKPSGVMRVFRDEIPQTQPQPSLGLPAVVYQLVSGVPLHKLDCVPSIDSLRIQFDVWAESWPEADAVFDAVRNVLELHGNTTYNFSGRDVETRDFRISFDLACWHYR